MLYPVAAILAVLLPAGATGAQDTARWESEAARVTITRDDWGIAHVHGRTDADAVFGMIYAQAEDDFNRVETNYLNALGRLAETEGESAIYQDLRMKLFIDPDTLKARYAESPAWLRGLMDAWADGLNYYLYRNPGTKPRVIARFEPWMALAFSEGSIGGDIESVRLDSLAAFYGGARDRVALGTQRARELLSRDGAGSNGIAIAPSNTASHHALLLINPHTSFFFRSELQMTSDEGLNAYGAVTWGQFFVYQGFNERAGWMHTSTGSDAIDEYLETVVKRGGSYFYRYGTGERPVVASRITIPYRTAGGMARREFTVYRTHHGPVVRESNGKWVTVRLMDEPVKALIQSFTRTKARSYAEYRKTMELHANSSNNTVFADADGDIAYFQANYIPRRDPRFDWKRPVEGTDTATEWHGVLSVDESPHLLNPASGWLYNSNNSPWSAAGAYSPKQSDYPAYVDTVGETPRGLHAIRVLEHTRDFTIPSLIAAAYDTYLTAFAEMIPRLLRTYDETPASNPIKARLPEQIAVLRAWDYRWSPASVATSLAVFYGVEAGIGPRFFTEQRLRSLDSSTVGRQLAALAAGSDKLTADFGTWKTPWGEINRFERITGDIVQPFADSAPSTPVGFPSAVWGSLASFSARAYPGTKRWYGTSGNSFVAVVEFGDRVRAKAVTAGGESGHPGSPHFNDEVARYATGNLRDVYFYPSDLAGHIERWYHPGGLDFGAPAPIP